MENKIDTLFKNKTKNILTIYFTAGFPKLGSMPNIIRSLQKTHIDLIEIGIPYSDPLADGPTIQYSNKIALENGMNLNLLFTQLETFKDELRTPLILMGYLNVIMQFGIEKFYKTCSKCHISGVILPDLPLEEYKSIHLPIASKYGVKLTLLLTPKTKPERIKEIDSLCQSFIYVTSSNATTGSKQTNFKDLKHFYKKLETKPLKNKTLIGFGIDSKVTLAKTNKLGSGSIIGSAFIKTLKSNTHLTFIKSLN